MDSGVGWGITGNRSYAAVDGLSEDSHERVHLLNVIQAAHCHSFQEKTSFDRALSTLPLALFTLQSLQSLLLDVRLYKKEWQQIFFTLLFCCWFWIRDLGSEIWDGKNPDPGSGMNIPDTALQNSHHV
jgi:hypothetical protein